MPLNTTIDQIAGKVGEAGKGLLQDKTMLNALLAGGGAAGLAGGWLSAAEPRRTNETRWSRRGRILRNALLAAAAGAGGAGLMVQGGRQFSTALPAEAADPVTGGFDGILSNPLTRLTGAGAAKAYLENKHGGLDRATAQQNIYTHLRDAASGLKKDETGRFDQLFPKRTKLQGGDFEGLLRPLVEANSPAITPEMRTMLVERLGKLRETNPEWFRAAGIAEKGLHPADLVGRLQHSLTGHKSIRSGHPFTGTPLARTLMAGTMLGLPEIVSLAGKGVGSALGWAGGQFNKNQVPAPAV